jgi:acyl-CoA synthetase (AMP-forming)/AMP-acid ligase II
MLGFLPFFHSFGGTAEFVKALITKKTKVVFAPSALDIADILEVQGRYKGNFTVGTNSFFQGLSLFARRKKSESLRPMHWGIAGAEAFEDHTDEMMRKVTSENYATGEAYGLTETGPGVFANDPKNPPSERGRFKIKFKHTEVEIVDEDLLEQGIVQKVEPGKEGVLLVRGKNVTPGYLGGVPMANVQLDGHTWFNTGDIFAYYPEQKEWQIFGRRTDRWKIGGEMVDRKVFQNALQKAVDPKSSNEFVVQPLLPTEPGGKIRNVLFTTRKDIATPGDANSAGDKAGLKGVYKIQKVVYIDKLPLAGSGKLDIKLLNRIANGKHPMPGPDGHILTEKEIADQAAKGGTETPPAPQPPVEAKVETPPDGQ